MRPEPPFGVLEAALMPVSLDRTYLAVLATWPELQERARSRCHAQGRLLGGPVRACWRTAAASSGSASLTGTAVASRRGRLSSAEHVPVASEGLR